MPKATLAGSKIPAWGLMADMLSSESHSIPRILPVPVLWGNCVYHSLYSWLPGLPANGTVRGAPSHQKVMAASGRALIQVTLTLSTSASF